MKAVASESPQPGGLTEISREVERACACEYSRKSHPLRRHPGAGDGACTMASAMPRTRYTMAPNRGRGEGKAVVLEGSFMGNIGGSDRKKEGPFQGICRGERGAWSTVVEHLSILLIGLPLNLYSPDSSSGSGPRSSLLPSSPSLCSRPFAVAQLSWIKC